MDNGTLTHDLIVKFDPQRQAVDLVFKPEEFKSYEFLAAIVKMVELRVELMRQMSIAQQMQQAAMRAQIEGQALKGIMRGK